MFHVEMCNFVSLQFWDKFHRLWNDLKAAFKIAKCQAWGVMMSLALVMNLSYGPAGKGTWHSDKQDWHADMLQELDSYSPAFRAVAGLIAKENNISEPTHDDDFAFLWGMVENLACIRLKGPLTKLMRWFSWQESAKFYTGQFYALKFVLDHHCKDEMHPQKHAAADIVLPYEVDPKKELNQLKCQMGAVYLAPKLISARALWVKDLILILNKPQWRYFDEQTKVLSPAQGLPVAVSESLGSWQHELVEMVQCTFYNRDNQHKLGLLVPNQCCETMVGEIVDLVLNVLHTRCKSQCILSTEPPFRYARVLGTTAQALDALSQMKRGFGYLVQTEAAYAFNPQ